MPTVAKFEYRCPVHGWIKPVPTSARPTPRPEACPRTDDTGRCGALLYVAESEGIAWVRQ